jgi:hypothetical protein
MLRAAISGFCKAEKRIGQTDKKASPRTTFAGNRNILIGLSLSEGFIGFFVGPERPMLAGAQQCQSSPWIRFESKSLDFVIRSFPHRNSACDVQSLAKS